MRINPYKLFYGCFVPNWLAMRTEVSADAKMVYARLAQFAGNQGCAYPKQPTLAKAVGCPERNLRRYLDELKKHKLIEVVQQGLRKPNLYYFLWHPWMDGNHDLTDEEMTELENAGIMPDRPFLADQEWPNLADQEWPFLATPSLRESLEENQKTCTSENGASASKKRRDQHYEEYPLFLRLWNIAVVRPTGSKGDKQAALKSWKSHGLEANPPLAEEVIKKYEYQKTTPGWQEKGGHYVKELHRWIEHKLWEGVVIKEPEKRLGVIRKGVS